MLRLAESRKQKIDNSDTEAEGVLVSAALTGKFFDIQADDFTDSDWAKSYRFIQKAYETGKKVSPEILKHRLKINPEKISFLKKSVSAEEIEVCSRIVKEKSALRKLFYCMKSLYTGGDVDLCLNQAQDIIRKYRSIGTKNSFIRAGDILEESLHDMEWGILYGFNQIDAWTQGMHKGELTILAGRPSLGKTTLGVQIATQVAQTNQVAFFSLEMRAKQIVRRAACSLTGLPAEKLMWDEEAQKKVKNMNLYIYDNPVRTLESLLDVTTSLKNTVGLDLIIIDYLQLLRLNKRVESRVRELEEISRILKLLALQLDIPVVVLSQLSRDVEKRGGRPKLSDLRGCGSIEQDADNVLILHRNGTQTELILEKQRNGPTGIVEVKLQPKIFRFEEIGEVID